MPRIPIAVQLYSVREDCERDLPATLQAVFDMGYEGVEFAGYYGYSARELRQMLDDLGLSVAGTHTGLNTLTGDDLKRTIEFNKTLGNRFLVCPAMPGDRRETEDDWRQNADLFNELAEKVAKHDMQVGYHNHHFEFQPVNGGKPWDIFASNTRDDVVLQLDTGNALHGGADPVELLKKYPGRAHTIHLKEYSDTREAPLVGEGEVDWKKVFELCESQGQTEWYIVEQESYRFEPIECIARCLENLEEMGK
ncbi:MAG: sugar phosphate isomerase/epimerase family protein [Planctomycetota bacterium]